MGYQLDNLTNPGVDPAPGDQVRVTLTSGASYVRVWPEPVSARPPVNVITIDEFLRRFTLEEVGKIRRLADTNDQVAGWLYWLGQQQSVDLDDSLITGPVTQAELFGVIAAGRAQEILAVPM